MQENLSNKSTLVQVMAEPMLTQIYVAIYYQATMS